MKALIRDSPDDSQTGGDFYEYPVFCQGGSRLGRLPPPLAVRTVVEGLIRPFSLAFGRTPLHLSPLNT